MSKKVLSNAKLQEIEQMLWTSLCGQLQALSGNGLAMKQLVLDQDQFYIDRLKAAEYSDAEIDQVMKYIDYQGL